MNIGKSKTITEDKCCRYIGEWSNNFRLGSSFSCHELIFKTIKEIKSATKIICAIYLGPLFCFKAASKEKKKKKNPWC